MESSEWLILNSMFPAYPGFENLPLRVEVEWRGRKRPVVARLEQWPNSDGAVLVCDFEDEEVGEWLVARGDAFWRPGTLHDWLCRYTVYNIATREPQSWSEAGQIKLRFCLQRALACGKLSFAVIYAVRDAPAPNLVLVESDVSYWCCGLERSSFVPFHLMRKLAANAQDAQHQLYSAWSDRASDARFAWDWANSTDHKRLYLLTGYAGACHEVERAMKMILRNKSSLWETESCWRWNLSESELSIESWSGADNERLEPWNRWVRNHYYPDPNSLLRREHPCVQELWSKRVREVRVTVNGPTSMHEQLEAQLWLREWLHDKVPAEQIKELLAV